MLRSLSATALVLLFAGVCFAGDKKVNFETIPPGAEVEVNGSIVCTTPCSINVPSYYFGAKRTAFAKHGEVPITVRLSKQGYITKTIEITTGPIHWKNLYGNNLYDYYLVSTTSYTVRLDATDTFFSQPSESHAEALPAEAVAPASATATPMGNEEIVRDAMPAIVVVSTPDGWGSGFLVSPGGVVVTNAHVVRGYSSATVTLSNGKAVASSDIYIDADRDLALIKIAGRRLPVFEDQSHAPRSWSRCARDRFSRSGLNAANEHSYKGHSKRHSDI